MKGTRLSDETIDKAKELRQEGLIWVEIGKKLDCTGESLRKAFIRRGIDISRDKGATPIARNRTSARWLSDDDIQKAVAMRSRGANWSDIGEKLGASGGGVRKALARLGLLKKKGTSMKKKKVKRVVSTAKVQRALTNGAMAHAKDSSRLQSIVKAAIVDLRFSNVTKLEIDVSNKSYKAFYEHSEEGQCD